MKSIDVKSLLIGFLLCATFFLSVGTMPGLKPANGFSPISKIGLYQLDSGDLLDTTNGVIYYYSNGHWLMKTSKVY